MRTCLLLALTVLVAFPTKALRAQAAPGASQKLQPGLPHSGISIKAGMGRYSFRDRYFSAERYSGTLPYLSVTWSKVREGGGFRLGVEHRTASDLRNHNISAGVTAFSLDLDFLYRLTTLSIFSRDATLFLGPSTGFFMHFSELNLAYSELEIPYSFAMLIPLGINSTLVLPVTERIQVLGSVRSTLISLGLRMIDLIEDTDDELPVGLLTFPSGTQASFHLGFRYGLRDNLSLDVGYELQLLRIRPWDPLLSVSDNLLAGFTVGF